MRYKKTVILLATLITQYWP